MEQLSTKKKIVLEALNLFAEKGYEAVSVAQIAAAVGIKAPSLYKHYKSKQDIFDAILAEMSERYEKQAATMQMNGTEPEQDVELFQRLDEEQLIEMGKSLFLYFLHDEYVAKFRKLLAMEQYHNRELADRYVEQYIDLPLSYQGAALGLLIGRDTMQHMEPNTMALQFYGPMFLLLTLCDCQPEREEEALQMIERHIRQFSELNKNKGETL
jgi:AcrR family transcriptional regulator